MSISRSVSVFAVAGGLGLLALATLPDPAEISPPAERMGTSFVAAATPVVAVAPAVAAQPVGMDHASELRDALAECMAGPSLGDLVVEVEAPLDQRPGIPLVLTRTGASGSTERVLELATDPRAQANVLRQFLQPGAEGGVLCVDFGFPTLGEHAVQVDAKSERAEFLLPERGWLAIEVLEADGAPLRAAAWAELRVLGATPPADRRHVCELVGGKVRAPLAATGLQMEVKVVPMDGRRLEPMTVGGPAIAGAVAPCVFRLPPRPSFTARLLDPAGVPVGNAAVVAWLEQRPSRLDASPTTDAAGRITLAAPAQPGALPVPVLFLVRTAEGRQLFATRDTELHEFAPTDLGDLRLQACQLLAAGRCVDAHGVPKGGAAVFAQTETTFDTRRRPSARGGWRDLAMDAVVTDADGAFRLFGPPQFGRRLRLSVRGEPRLVVPFVEGAPDLAVSMPGRRRGAPVH